MHLMKIKEKDDRGICTSKLTSSSYANFEKKKTLFIII